MLKVALIHPDYKNKVYETLSVPLGLAWISACLKTTSVLVDCYDFAKDPQRISEFGKITYNILFVQLHSQETLNETLQWLQEIKKVHNQTIIVVGGIAVDLNTEMILSHKFIDIASLGEGEQTTIDICQAIRDGDSFNHIKGIAYKNPTGTIVYTEKRPINYNIDQLPMPDRESFGIDYPQWTIVTARGCPFKCKFCSMPRTHNQVRFREVKKVYEEICYLRDNYKMSKFFLADDTFTIHRNRVIELCQYLICDEHKVEWTCVTRADILDEELLYYMKNAGCVEISCGIESANEDIQKIIGKNLNLQKAKENLLFTKKAGIKVRCSFIFGLPGENIDHILNSISFMKEIRPNEIQIYPYVPYSGTEFMDFPSTYNIHSDSIEFKSKKNLMEPFVDLESLSKKDIIDISRQCVESLKNIGYLWIPGDIPPKKQKLDYVVMTEFSPVQALC